MKLVLDTNAVLDWLHFKDGGFAPLAQAIDQGELQLVTSEQCLAELREVLARRPFGLDEEECAAHLAHYRAVASVQALAQGPPQLPLCRDPDDQKFLVLAAQAGAACLLTKDKDLLRLSRRVQRQAGFWVLTPQRFAAEVLQRSSARR